MRTAVALLFLLILHSLAAPARASTITVQASGTWQSANDKDGLLDGSVGVGTPFVLTFRYDDGSSGTDTPGGGRTYDFPAGSFELSLATGHYVFSVKPTSAASLDISSGGTSDSIAVLAYGFNAIGPSAPVFSNLAYLNPSNLALPAGTFSSNALVGLPWASLAGLLDVYFFGSPNGVSFVEFDGTPTTITVVPEPVTLELVCVGLALLGLGARRRV